MTTARELSLLDRLTSNGPKRILSLDGGGIRGCSTLGFLEKIEGMVQARMGAGAKLSDYFDLIGGTSTGAIIASFLALGWSVERVTETYLALGPEVFSKRRLLARVPFVGKKLVTQWSVHPLEKRAIELLSDESQPGRPPITLGSPLVKTGLCIVTKRADTFSTWPYINHPNSQYPENGRIPLWKLVRASSAAPTFFRPLLLDVGEEGKPDPAVFIDGGVSMANNPAVQLFLVATLDGFRFKWKTGRDQLLLVSVGTGRFTHRLDTQEVLKSENVYWARNVPELLMQDATDHNELLLQYLSQSATARHIDHEVGDLRNDLLGGKPLLSYVRFNAELDRDSLESVGISTSKRELESLRDMSAGKNARRHYEIGRAFAERRYSDSHFPNCFDPKPNPGVAGDA